MKKEDKINPFDMINKVDELPPELKKEVMATINFAHLASDIGQLFTIDMGKTAGRMLGSEGDDESGKTN